jgi:hypothetical protein
VLSVSPSIFASFRDAKAAQDLADFLHFRANLHLDKFSAGQIGELEREPSTAASRDSNSCADGPSGFSPKLRRSRG